MKRILSALLFVIIQFGVYGQDALLLDSGEAYITIKNKDEGLDLYIKAKPGRGSVLITESSADPNKKLDSFALRTYEPNPTNIKEDRILNGEYIDPSKGLYFLIDSTPEPNEYLESAFHIFIPYNLTYGYPWSRQGQVEITQGTWLNIRLFEKPYADYSGAYKDNPRILDRKELPQKKLYTAPMLQDFQQVPGTPALLSEIDNILARASGDVDLVLVIDTTISMKDDIAFIQKELMPLVKQKISKYSSFRMGVVLYRDYKEAYLTKEYDFETDINKIQMLLDSISVSGGRDLEEAVYEGIYSGIINFNWNAPTRMIIQVGDALPHQTPKGEISRTTVLEGAKKKNISIYPLLLPDEK